MMKFEEIKQNVSLKITKSDVIKAFKDIKYIVNELCINCNDVDQLGLFMGCFDFSALLKNSLSDVLFNFSITLDGCVENLIHQNRSRSRTFTSIKKMSRTLKVVIFYLENLENDNLDIDIATFYSRVFKLYDYCVDKRFIDQIPMANEAKEFVDDILSSDCHRSSHKSVILSFEKVESTKDRPSGKNKKQIFTKKINSERGIANVHFYSDELLKEDVFNSELYVDSADSGIAIWNNLFYRNANK